MKTQTKFKEKICVTGHRGFIGKHILEELNGNYDIVGYDLKDGNDIRDKFKLEDLFYKERFDAVVHLAAVAGTARSDEFPDEYISTNVLGTKYITEMCKKYNVKTLIHFSSSSVVAGNNMGRGAKEGDPYNPVNLYGITKIAGEMIVKNSGVNYVIVRPFTVVGENGRKDSVVYRWIEQIKRGEMITVYGANLDTSRGYTCVKDVAIAVDKLLELMLSGHPDTIVNIGGSEVIKISTLVGIFDKHCKKNNIKFDVLYEDLSAGDVEESYADTYLAKNLIDFEPKSIFKDVINGILKKEL